MPRSSGRLPRLLPGLLLLLALTPQVALARTPGALPEMPVNAPSGLPLADTIPAGHADPAWYRQDKAYHFTASAVGAAGFYAIGRELGLGRWTSALGASVLMGSVGLLRETFQRDDPNLLTRSKFSKGDMVWNVTGIVVGISVTDLVGQLRWRQPAEPPLEPAP